MGIANDLLKVLANKELMDLLNVKGALRPG